LKEKVLNEEGRKQQSKLRELTLIATSFDCTIAQLAIGKCRLLFVLFIISIC